MAKKKMTEEMSPEERKKRAYMEEIRLFFTRLIVLVAAVWILFGFVFGIAPMKNNDMSPRISAGDVMFYYRLEKKLTGSDVIVFEKDGKQYVGRIVAKGGDTVEITENSMLEINGSIVVENDIFYDTPQYESNVTYPVTLGDDQYFVLGDFREGAKDSRYFGAVNEDEIKGKVITVIRRSSL